MNNTQLIENTLLLEKKVKEQAETIQALEKKVEGIHNVVYQLVGGLFNQRTQDIVLEEHMRHLFPDLYTNNNFQDNLTSEMDIWPTTRQGDENSERIKVLEDQIRVLQQNYYEEETVINENDDDCVSQINIYDEVLSVSSSTTHSSMPDLIEVDSDGDSRPELIDDDSDDDSMPELYSESLRELSLRLRNSFDLCGNA